MAKVRAKEFIADYKRITSDLKNKIYKPVYLLMGEEAYYIDQISNYIQEHVLNDAEKSFNQMVLYGKETNVNTVIEAARRFPMMGNYQVIIVKEAQLIRDIEALEKYVAAPLKSTILVICYKGKSVDKRKAFYKQIVKTGSEVFETSELYENEVPAWITDYLKNKQRTIEPAAASILADHLGADLSRIVNELDKLAVVVAADSKITAADIERNIGISKDYNPFELNKAITSGNVLKANRIIQHFERNPSDYPMVMIISTLFGEFSRIFKLHMLRAKYRGAAAPQAEAAAVTGINTFFLKDYDAVTRRYSPTKTAEVIALLREFDMRSKGWNNASADSGDLLRELVYKIMH